jgi:hypothetical protein
VDDLYTDPQMHSVGDNEQYGVGNLGHLGIAMFFQNHRCNDICSSLGLAEVALSKAQVKAQDETPTQHTPPGPLCAESDTVTPRRRANPDGADATEKNAYKIDWIRELGEWTEADLANVMFRMPFVWDTSLEWPAWEHTCKTKGTLHAFIVADLIETPDSTNHSKSRGNLLWHIFKCAENGVPPACEFCVTALAHFLSRDKAAALRDNCHRGSWAGYAGEDPICRSGLLELLQDLASRPFDLENARSGSEDTIDFSDYMSQFKDSAADRESSEGSAAQSPTEGEPCCMPTSSIDFAAFRSSDDGPCLMPTSSIDFAAFRSSKAEDEPCLMPTSSIDFAAFRLSEAEDGPCLMPTSSIDFDEFRISRKDVLNAAGWTLHD